VAIMDAWWEPLIRAVYDPVIGDASRIPLPFDNAPSSGGSAYQDGWYGYLWTDFSMALGDKISSPTSRIYCGGSREATGSLAACAPRVLAALKAAGDKLGGDDPSAWSADAEGERIRFLPGAALSMQWVNRPTTQQLAMFGAHAQGAGASTTACATTSVLAGARATPRGRGLAFTVPARPTTVDVVRQSVGRRVAPRRVRRFPARSRPFAWNGRAPGVRDGVYVVRFGAGSTARSLAFRHTRGRFRALPALERVRNCGPVRKFALARPVFGALPLTATVRVANRRRVRLELRRGGRVVRTLPTRTLTAGRTHRLRLPARRNELPGHRRCVPDDGEGVVRRVPLEGEQERGVAPVLDVSRRRRERRRHRYRGGRVRQRVRYRHDQFDELPDVVRCVPDEPPVDADAGRRCVRREARLRRQRPRVLDVSRRAGGRYLRGCPPRSPCATAPAARWG